MEPSSFPTVDAISHSLPCVNDPTQCSLLAEDDSSIVPPTSDCTIYITAYTPESVTEIIGAGGSAFIGAIDKDTVLKYPIDRNDVDAPQLLEFEAQMLEAINSEYVIKLKGRRADGLLLERAAHGSLASFLDNEDHFPDQRQRLTWMMQTTHALGAAHEAGVMHRDIKVGNILLDEHLRVKLCDFQGRLRCPDGTWLDGKGACEMPKSFMPRDEPSYADIRTDIFALASAFYYIWQGEEPYPDLDEWDDEDEIGRRFTTHDFPVVAHPIETILHKCWAGEYESTKFILQDLQLIRDGSPLSIFPHGNTNHWTDFLYNAVLRWWRGWTAFLHSTVLRWWRD